MANANKTSQIRFITTCILYIYILVNKRNNTKILIKYICMLKVKTNTIVYYHVCQCLCEMRLSSQERRSPGSVKMNKIEWWVWFRLEMTHQTLQTTYMCLEKPFKG
jgi:hypothetical protein